MKKIILLVWAAVCVLTACNEKNTFTLNGTFANGDQNGKVIYLHPLDSLCQIIDPIDSAKVENDKFVFKGLTKEPLTVQMVVIDASIMPAAFIVEKGNIKMNFDSELNATVTGTPMNDKYREFEKTKADIVMKIDSLFNQFTSDKQSGDLTSDQFQDLRVTVKQSESEMGNVIYNFLKPIIATPAGQYFFIDNLLDLNDAQKRELIASASSDFKNMEAVQILDKRLALRETTSPGQLFTDVKGFDPDGKGAALSDYAGKGKIVLVDFWASWCGPCVRSMPELITIYQKYKSMGFEIVGISLDNSKDDWKKAITSLIITWPQFSNLKGWDDDCAVAYGIDAIPHLMLIDKDGKIMDRNLNTDEVNFKLQELLEKK